MDINTNLRIPFGLILGGIVFLTFFQGGCVALAI